MLMTHLIEVTAADFDTLIMDFDNDVLLILCDYSFEICQQNGHAPMFKSLANVFSSTEFHDFTVARFDPALNTWHRSWGPLPTAYPTFRYYSKLNKRAPVDFVGVIGI